MHLNERNSNTGFLFNIFWPLPFEKSILWFRFVVWKWLKHDKIIEIDSKSDRYCGNERSNFSKFINVLVFAAYANFPENSSRTFFFENKKLLGVGKTKFKIRGQPHLFSIELGTFFK